jgi:hypothetical protein
VLLVAALILLGAAKEVASADPAHLKPGDYVWHPEVAPEGPLVIIVSLDEQRVYVYRNGIAIGLSTMSSGRRGYETPPGIYSILQKDRDHHSNKYDDAPMPYMERLTWDGVALHGGQLPGYPASHGCVRLPHRFAEVLFGITRRGDTVVVANSRISPADVVHPAVLAPISTLGDALARTSTTPFTWSWDDSAAPSGPVSILVSVGDRKVYVLRNGMRIGSSVLNVSEGFALSGTLLLVAGPAYEPPPGPPDQSQSQHRWTLYPIAGESRPIGELAANLRVPDDFARLVYRAIAPGTTVVVTNLPAMRDIDRLRPEPVIESDPR